MWKRHAMRELPEVVTQLKDVIERINVQISTPASTWPTPTPSVEPPVSPPTSPLVLSDPDDMVPLVPDYDVKVQRRKLKSHWGSRSARLWQRNTVQFKLDRKAIWGSQRCGV
ncbi:hypothetical protein CRENBAI_014668 [Crenichthys baileyi]|uniref:Uncharacterized protein n=1 Tax=Crenichthys baileyi TaxID=28760 RepID=A0AAV9RY69_9TELE